MSDERNHAGGRRDPSHADKSPSSLPGPNRFPDADRYGEALAPGTIPDEERKERKEKEGAEEDAEGVDRP